MDPFLSYKRGETPLDYRKRIIKGLKDELLDVEICLEERGYSNFIKPYLMKRQEILKAQIDYYKARKENQNASQT